MTFGADSNSAIEQRVIRVLCVDDTPDLVALLHVCINAEADMECLGSLPSADGLLDQVLKQRPDIVLLDLTMPGRSPLEALRELAEKASFARVIVFSGYDAESDVDRAVEAGAWGFISKSNEMAQVLSAIRRVAAGDFALM